MSNTPSANSFTTRLDREWDHLRRQPRSVRRARAWAASDPCGPHAARVAGLTDLQELIDLTRGDGAGDLEADALLLRLIEIAADDALAGRVVIQRVLPGLISRSARYRSQREPAEPIELAVAAAWIALRQYDWRRRRRHVAASLISDATFQAFRRPLRRRAATERVRPPHDFGRIEAGACPASAFDELVVVLRDATAAGLPPGDVDLFRRLVDVGSPGQLALECGVTPRTIRNRRNAAIARVQAALAA